MIEHTKIPWRNACFQVYGSDNSKIAHTGMGQLPPYRSSESEANAEFIVKACNSHDALVNALQLLEKAEEFHANCEECNGEDIPELCEKCFPHYDDARVARRIALDALALPRPQSESL